MTNEQAFENAVAVLREWSEGRTEMCVALATIAELMARRELPEQTLSVGSDSHSGRPTANG